MDDIETLKQRRADLEADLHRVGAAIDRLVEVEAGVNTAQAALDGFDADAAAAMLEWAMNGADGESPESDHLARMGLTRAVARAKAAAAAADGARCGLDVERVALHGRLHSVSIEIETVAFKTIAGEHEALLREFKTKTVPNLRGELARISACRDFLHDRAQKLHAQGETAAATGLFQILERMDLPTDVLRAGAAPTPEDMAKNSHAWRKRQDEITGAPTTREVVLPDVEAARRWSEDQIKGNAKADFDHVTRAPKPGNGVVEHLGAA